MRSFLPPLPLPAAVCLAVVGALAAGGCGDDGGPGAPETIVYSREIQPLFARSCLASCHDAATHAAGLDLTSWDALIRGSENGEVVIPFRSGRSHMVHRLMGMGSDSSSVSHSLLSGSESARLSAWIDAGARNDAGEVPYANSTRKIYVASQGADEVSVLDLDALVVFRIVDVGTSPNLDGPHNIWVDGPGRRWYVSLINAQPGVVAQYDAATDAFLARAVVGDSPANGVTSADGSRVYVTNWDQRTDRLGTVRVIDAASMTVVDTIQVGGRPHGITMSPDGRYLYTTNYYTDDVSVVDLSLPEPAEVSRIPVALDTDPLTPLEYQPNDVVVSPDGRFLFISLFQQDRAEVRVLDLEGDSLYAVVPTGGSAFLEELSPGGGELYVADWGSNTVSVIRAPDLVNVATLADGHFSKPHGVAFSPDGRYAFVTSENRDGTAPEHHPGSAGGPNGNLAVIDTATREVVKVLELGPVAAGIAVRE